VQHRHCREHLYYHRPAMHRDDRHRIMAPFAPRASTIPSVKL
jgi:hypothetical protein